MVLDNSCICQGLRFVTMLLACKKCLIDCCNFFGICAHLMQFFRYRSPVHALFVDQSACYELFLIQV